MTQLSFETIHASAVAILGRAVLLYGRSGSGKSDLALRLIDRGASLISDDYTVCHARDNALFASAPGSILDRIEVRGLGIVNMPSIQDIPIALLINLESDVDRFPLDRDVFLIAGHHVPMVALEPFHASAPIKVELALQLIEKP